MGSGYRYCLHYHETQSGKSRLIAEFGLYGELLHLGVSEVPLHVQEAPSTFARNPQPYAAPAPLQGRPVPIMAFKNALTVLVEIH